MGGYIETSGFPGGSVVRNPLANAGDAGDTRSIPGSGRSPGEGNGNPLKVFLPGKSRGQRSLEGSSPPRLQRAGHDWATEHTNTHRDKQEVIGELSFKLVLERVGQALSL